MKAAQIVRPDPEAEASFGFGQRGQVFQDQDGHLFAVADSFDGVTLALGTNVFDIQAIPPGWVHVKYILEEEKRSIG